MRRVTPEEMDESTPELIDEVTMEIGQFYRSHPSGAVVDGRREDEPACLHPDKTRGRPGARVPHAWLPDGSSTVDVATQGLTWLLGPEAPAQEGARLSAETAASCGIASAGAMLVRPDGYVAEVR
jgi:putative polyketide hydroxylase